MWNETLIIQTKHSFWIAMMKAKIWDHGGKYAKEAPKWREKRQQTFSFCDIIFL